MYYRTEQILTLLAFVAALAIAAVALFQIDNRSDETISAQPTAEPTAAATVPPTEPAPEATQAPPEAPQPTEAPTDAPTAGPAESPGTDEEPPVLAAPTAAPPGATPMPHTGADPAPAGLALIATVVLIALVARHTEARIGRS